MSDFEGDLDGRLAEGTQINGELKFQRTVQIDGRFDGKVKSAGKLILGPTAEVNADVDVGELEVRGNLRGKVKASKKLLIRDGGKVEANVSAGRLAIEAGALFRGQCEMPEAAAPPAGKDRGAKIEAAAPKPEARP